MSIVVPQTYVQRWFARAYSNGEAFDATMYASFDAQHAMLVETMNLLTQRLNLISTPSGTLITLDSTTSFSATAGQTAFTVPTYNITTDTVHVYLSGVRLAAASITKTSETVVTIPAQTLGTAVQIDIFTPGNGTTALASTSVGQGAALVGINDAGGYFTATTVEGGMQELGANITSAAFLGGVLTISNYIKKDGSVTYTAAQSMGGFKLTNLAAGTAASNDAARMADITSANLQAILAAYLAATYLPLTGGTMSGNIAMGGNRVTGLAAAIANGQAVRYEEFQTINGSQITAGTVAGARLAVMVGDTGAGGTQGAVPAPAAGDAAAGKFLRADAVWSVPAANLGQRIILEHIIASGTNGGNAGALAWTTRPINTETLDTGGNCTLAANQFTLAAGTYQIDAEAVMHNTNESGMRLRNITDGATTLVGVGGYIDNTDPTSLRTTVKGRFTIGSPKTYELQYWAGAAKATDGLGMDLGTGENNIFLRAIFVKE